MFYAQSTGAVISVRLMMRKVGIITVMIMMMVMSTTTRTLVVVMMIMMMMMAGKMRLTAMRLWTPHCLQWTRITTLMATSPPWR